jgi:two-component system OmpR family sensor kinase/two-component system sensor histidine kinase BaeS
MRTRLLLSFVLVVLVSVVGVVVFARQGAASTVRAFMYRGGMVGSDELAAQLQEYYAQHGSWEGVESLLGASGRGQGQGMMHGQGQGMMMGQRLRLADSSGTVIADTSAAPSGKLSADEKSVAIPLKVNGRTVGYLSWRGGMAFTAADQSFLLSRLTRAAITAGLIAAGLSLLLALLLSYTLMRPVRELTQAARRLGERDLSQRVRVSGRDELAELARTFNRMADSLQQAEESRKALTADIAHELRTPLAVQRASLEAMQDGVYPLTPDNLASVLEQNLLLTRLVDDLRTLALADAGRLTLERTPTDLAALVRRTVERFQPQANARNIALQFDVEQTAGSFMRNVDPQRIEQILSNLLTNALRYTPDGGQIAVRLAAAPSAAGDVQITVHDSGPGIPAEALPYVFERFYRADRSRSRSEGGSGLGLAIARQLAEAHGGSLTAANHAQGGAVFSLTLPGR